jgi:hydrogenase expression/formation protein HypC
MKEPWTLPEVPREVACSLDDGCLTCGDIAVPLVVTAVGGVDVRCQDEQGREELVATELVGEVAVGDSLLVHAGVALEHLGRWEDRKGKPDALR